MTPPAGMRPLNVGLLGFGTVGKGVLRRAFDKSVNAIEARNAAARGQRAVAS